MVEDGVDAAGRASGSLPWRCGARESGIRGPQPGEPAGPAVRAARDWAAARRRPRSRAGRGPRRRCRRRPTSGSRRAHLVAQRAEELGGLLHRGAAARIEHRRGQGAGGLQRDGDPELARRLAGGLGERAAREPRAVGRIARLRGRVEEQRGVEHGAGQKAVHRHPVPGLDPRIDRDSSTLGLEPEQRAVGGGDSGSSRRRPTRSPPPPGPRRPRPRSRPRSRREPARGSRGSGSRPRSRTR